VPGANLKLISEIKIGERHRKDLGDLRGLAKSIETLGILHPIVITPNGRLVAGLRRLKACKEILKWDKVPTAVFSLDLLQRAESDENTQRLNYTPEEAVNAGVLIEEEYKRLAKEAQRRGGRKPRGVPPSFLGQDESKRALAMVGKVVGMDRQTYVRAKAVVEAAEKEPARYAPLVAEMNRTRKVNGAFRKLKVDLQSRAIAKEPPALPKKGPYRVIVADPPWRSTKRVQALSTRGVAPYPTMSLVEICALKVNQIAHKDSVLWLWTTNAHLPEAFEVVKAWGFTYKTVLTWVKPSTQKPGLGDWLRGRSEHCLLCTIGKPTVKLTNQTTVLEAPRTKHSAKPDAFYAMVEKMCPGNKVELFQRKPREGWDSHGDESGKK
jgi:N6-adenosine-specific RNA methylase IME4/ParB-like chromosome segregation protein Spo0J